MKLQSLAGADDIVLQAVPGALDLPDEFVRVPDEAGRRPELTLIQKQSLFGPGQRLVLFNGHYLECSQEQGVGPAKVVNLAYLSDEPLVVRQNAWRWMVAGLVALAGLSVTVVFDQWRESLLLGMIALLSLGMYFPASRNRLVFRTRYGGIAVFELCHGLFGARRSLDFARLLQERIRGAAVVLPPGQQRLAAEMAEHRRMLMDGWLSRSRYELARKRIFARFRKERPRGPSEE